MTTDQFPYVDEEFIVALKARHNAVQAMFVNAKEIEESMAIVMVHGSDAHRDRAKLIGIYDVVKEAMLKMVEGMKL